MAEAVFNHVLKKKGIEEKFVVDSAAVAGYHIGKRPDARAVACLASHAVPVDHKARVLTVKDFEEFDYIFGMDEDNMEDIRAMQPEASKAKVELFGAYYGQETVIIEDPYYGGKQGFEVNYEQVTACSHGFLQHLGYN
jgi:low molecular weight phosphotyrosine protein phosphatase